MIINRATRSKIFLGKFAAASALTFCFAYTLDKLTPLPEEFQNKKYPIMARYYLRKGLLLHSSIKEQEKDLDLALRVVINKGLGHVSPEANGILLYTSNKYLLEYKDDKERLEKAYNALIKKPHVGEGVVEEVRRISLALKVAKRLCEVCSGDPSSCKEQAAKYANWAMFVLQKAPSYFPTWWKEQNDYKEFFKKYSSLPKE